jgi:hypothetical protein
MCKHLNVPFNDHADADFKELLANFCRANIASIAELFGLWLCKFSALVETSRRASRLLSNLEFIRNIPGHTDIEMPKSER